MTRRADRARIVLRGTTVWCTAWITVILSAVSAPVAGLAAQDAHYATYQYGPRANLLGGAVVGSAVDLSATFYNPGALARLDSVAIIATSQTFELTNLVFQPTNELTSINLNDLGFGEAPGFVGGTLPFNFLGRSVLAYSVLTRYRFKTNLGDTRGFSSDLPDLEGDAYVKLRFQRDLSEQWFGLTYAAPTGSLGLGISQYVAYRSQDGGNLALAEVFPARDDGAISIADQEFGYWTTRVLWKLGASFDWVGFSLGVAATTPSVHLFGSGRLEANRTVFGQDADGDSILDPTFVAGAQDGLSPNYKSPGSIALGGTFRGAGTDFYVSAEYVARVGEYVVLEADPQEGQSTGDSVGVALTSELDDVLNVNVGVERAFSDRWTGYASFWTDFSAFSDANELDPAVASWDILFVSLGSAVRLGTSEVTLGVTYGWGSSVDVQVIRGELNDEILSRLAGKADLAYRSLRLLVALSI